MYRLILILFAYLISCVSAQAGDEPSKMLYTCSSADRVVYLTKNDDMSFALLDRDGVRFLQGSFQRAKSKSGVPLLTASISGTFVILGPAEDGQRLVIIYPDTTEVEYDCR